MKRLKRSMIRRMGGPLAGMTVGLVLAMTVGGAYAAQHYLITSTHQIKPNVLRSLKGATGPAGPTGANGQTGGPGQQGVQGVQGPAGPPGPVGQAGTAGATGPAGPPGGGGTQGATGPAGGFDQSKTHYRTAPGYQSGSGVGLQLNPSVAQCNDGEQIMGGWEHAYGVNINAAEGARNWQPPFPTDDTFSVTATVNANGGGYGYVQAVAVCVSP